MAFTYPTTPPSRDFADITYALYRVRQIARDTRENPPFSLSDEEWTEFLEDTKQGQTYQVFTAVLRAVSTNPDRLSALSEASGSYTFTDLGAVRTELVKAQRELNKQLGLTSRARSTPTQVVW